MTTLNPKKTPEEESRESNEENKQPEKEDEVTAWDLRMGAEQGTPITSGGDEAPPEPGTPITSGGDD